MGALSFPTSHVRQDAFSAPIGRQSQVRNLDRVVSKTRPFAARARVTVPFQISAKTSNDERQVAHPSVIIAAIWYAYLYVLRLSFTAASPAVAIATGGRLVIRRVQVGGGCIGNFAKASDRHGVLVAGIF